MPGPLEGIRVLDFSAVISGPMAALALADQGADVIKVEPIVIGDITRLGGYRVDDISAMFVAANRGKRSLALDLSKQAGHMMVERQIRLPAEVGHVHCNPTTGLNHPVCLDEDTLEKSQIVLEAQVPVVILTDVVRRRGDHERNTGVG